MHQLSRFRMDFLIMLLFLFIDVHVQGNQKNAIKEAFRVLKHNGTLAIWDAVIENAAPDPFLIDLRIHINDLIVETTYGVGKEDAFQNSSTIIDLCENAGFKLKNALKDGASFNLIFIK